MICIKKVYWKLLFLSQRFSFFYYSVLQTVWRRQRASVFADLNSFSNSSGRLQLWCNHIIFTLLLFSVIEILLSWLKWFLWFPLPPPRPEHSFCWALFSLPGVLSQFIFSFHLLTPSLFKVSLVSFKSVWCHSQWHPPSTQYKKPPKFQKDWCFSSQQEC